MYLFPSAFSVSYSVDLWFFGELWCPFLPEYQSSHFQSLLYVMESTGYVSSFLVLSLVLRNALLLAYSPMLFIRSTAQPEWLNQRQQHYNFVSKFYYATFMASTSNHEIDWNHRQSSIFYCPAAMYKTVQKMNLIYLFLFAFFSSEETNVIYNSVFLCCRFIMWLYCINIM